MSRATLGGKGVVETMEMRSLCLLCSSNRVQLRVVTHRLQAVLTDQISLGARPVPHAWLRLWMLQSRYLVLAMCAVVAVGDRRLSVLVVVKLLL